MRNAYGGAESEDNEEQRDDTEYAVYHYQSKVEIDEITNAYFH